MSEDPLALLTFWSLITPVDERSFLNTYFERRPLHVPQSASALAAHLSASLDIEAIVWRDGRRWGDVSLARPDVAQLSGGNHGQHPPSLAAVRRAYRDGFTVVVNDLQRKEGGVARLCRVIERDLFCRANVNLYATGPGCAGLAPHYDDDDVLILQIRGAKAWRIGAGQAALPPRHVPYHEDRCRDARLEELTLMAGDVLYLPRGTVHSAQALEEPSVHLTIALRAITQLELICEMLKLLAEGVAPALNRSVPLVSRRGGPVGPDADLDEPLMATLFDEGLRRAALARLVDGLLASMDEVPTPTTAPIGGVAVPSHHVRLAEDQFVLVDPLDDGATLRSPAGTFEFPAELAELPARIKSGHAFDPADLPDGAGTAVAALLDRGLLRRTMP